MNILRTAVLAALAAGAAFAGQASAASSALISVAHPTYMRHGDAVMGNLPAAQPIHFLMSLKMRDRDGLNVYIANMKNHPGQVMSSAEFMAKHAPTQAQVDAVTSFLKAQGFTRIEVRPNNLLISAWGNAGSVSRAFNTQMVRIKTNEGRIAYGNATDALIPAALQSQVLGVVGLQTVNVGHTFANPVKAKPGNHTMAASPLLPTDFPTIYNATGVSTGAGVAVGIFTQGSMTTTISDLNRFTAANGYPTVTTQQVNTDGTGTSTSGTDEWDLDSQTIVGMAGGQVGKIIWYQTSSLSDTDIVDNLNTIVNANAAKIVNVSIGGCESSSKGATATASDQAFAQGVVQGQTFSIATGAEGGDECGDGGSTPSWPANSQYVVAVAGTTLSTSGSGWSSEVLFPADGGTESKYEPKPSWQPSTCTLPCKYDGKFRAVADVAFDANPGVELYLNGASPSAATAISGTSLSAALFAGEWTRVIATKGTAVGFAAPIIYKLPAAAFHDITSGTETNGAESAAVGWDVASGWGSINLSAALANWESGGGLTVSFADTVSGLTASFTDTSTDTSGTITAHAWKFGDGSTSTATNPSHTYTAAGTYTATETVTDSTGASSSVSKSVLVEPTGGGTPTANWTDTTSGLTATFTDTSTDSGGTISTHAWNFGDNSTSAAASPSHTYAAAGTYSVSETVTDSASGKTSAKTASVTVSGTAPTQLLGNTGFENATAAPWTAGASVLCTNSTCSGEVAHAGTGFAWLDGYGTTHTDTLSQPVTITAGKTTATLKYYLHIDTAETSTTAKDDTLTVALYNGTTLLKTLATYSNLNANTGYTVHTNDVSAYIGQAVTLKFTGKENASLQTSFVLDDVTLTVQ